MPSHHLITLLRIQTGPFNVTFDDFSAVRVPLDNSYFGLAPSICLLAESEGFAETSHSFRVLLLRTSLCSCSTVVVAVINTMVSSASSLCSRHCSSSSASTAYARGALGGALRVIVFSCFVAVLAATYGADIAAWAGRLQREAICTLSPSCVPIEGGLADGGAGEGVLVAAPSPRSFFLLSKWPTFAAAAAANGASQNDDEEGDDGFDSGDDAGADDNDDGEEPSSEDSSSSSSRLSPKEAKARLWNGRHIRWHHSWTEAKEAARRSRKPILLHFWKEKDCPACKVLERSVSSSMAMEVLSEHFEMVLLPDSETPEEAQFTALLAYSPRTYFLNYKGRLLDVINEYSPSEEHLHFYQGAEHLVLSMKAVLRDESGFGTFRAI